MVFLRHHPIAGKIDPVNQMPRGKNLFIELHECWNNDPVTVLPGTTGDYRRSNSTAAELPQYDPLIVPFDSLDAEYMPEAYTPPVQAEVDPSGETDIVSSDPAESESTDQTIGSLSDPGSSEDKADDNSLRGKFLSTSLGRFVDKNPFISGVVVGLVALIIFLVLIIIIRTANNGKRKRRTRPYTGDMNL